MPQEPTIFKALRQQLLWPSIHAAVDVYQRRRASAADHYELIWRLIHICEASVITLAAAAITCLRETGKAPEYLKLRERCYGIGWNPTEGSLEKGLGALDGSIDKWIEIVQHVGTFSIDGSGFLSALQTFLSGAPTPPGNGPDSHQIDLKPLVIAWSRACEVPPSVLPENVSVKDALQAINSFRNRFAHIPFPYDQLQEIYRELESCTFRIFEVPPAPTAGGSPLSGSFAVKDSILRGPGYWKTPETWQSVGNESFVWGEGTEAETWDARPFVFLDKMMRPYLLSRLKNEAGSWEYTRYLAEANAVYTLTNVDLLKLLPPPVESDYHKEEPLPSAVTPVDAQSPALKAPINSREEAFAAVRQRDFEPAIEFWRSEVSRRQNYHSGWQRLGFAQREYAVDLFDSDAERARELLDESVVSFTRAIGHQDPQYEAEAYYNRSKSRWRIWRLSEDSSEFTKALGDAQKAVQAYYDHRFVSWSEFLKENRPPGNEAH